MFLAYLDSLLIGLLNFLIYLENKFTSVKPNERIFSNETINEFLKNNVGEAIIWISLVSLVVSLVLKFFRHNNKKAVHKILEDSHLDIFSVKPDKDSNNRITYYKETFIPLLRPCFFDQFPFIKIQFGIGKYLVISSRTGRFQESITKFKINKDKEEKNYGIAGNAWYLQNEIVKEEGLPPSDGSKSTIYAKKTKIKVKDLPKFNVKGTSILGVAIQDVDGKRRGALVIDTRHEAFSQTTETSVWEVTKKLMYVV